MYGVMMFLMMAFERENNFSKSAKMESFGGGSNYSLRMFFSNERYPALLSFLCLSPIHSISHALLKVFVCVLLPANSGLAPTTIRGRDDQSV
jgi:hypothetical protein